MKICPHCDGRFADHEHFCSTCAGSDGRPVALLIAMNGPITPTNPSGSPSIAIGKQAVVSGEVIARKEQHIYKGTANITNILQVDDTKQVHTCAICGLKGTIASGFHICPGCSRITCADHFDKQARLCINCNDSASAVREDIYRQQARHFLDKNGLIDPWERKHLEAAQRSLGLTTLHAAALEQSVKKSLPGPTWGHEQQRQMEAARALLVKDDKFDQAVAYLEPLALRHPEHHELQSLWLEALAEHDPERALAATEQAQANVPAVYLVRARLLAERGRYQEGLDLLTDASSKRTLEVARIQFIATAVEIYIRHFLETGNHLFLTDAAARLDEVSGSKDPYVLAVTAWLAQLRDERTAPTIAFTGTACDLHLRRIRRMMTGTNAAATSRLGSRVFHSHTHQKASFGKSMRMKTAMSVQTMSIKRPRGRMVKMTCHHKKQNSLLRITE